MTPRFRSTPPTPTTTPTPRALAAAALAAALAFPAAAQTVVIGFDFYPGPDGQLGTPDDIPIVAPTLFANQAEQLTAQFAALGILFTPDPPINDKNEILMATSFSPPAIYSPPNILASASAATIEGRFTVPVTEVGAILGIGGGADRLDIYDAANTLLGSITADNVFATIAAPAGAGPIDRFVITGATAATPAIDNLTFVVAPAACYANCDQSTTAPILNVADFGCFLTRYAAGEPYANCDQSTTPPVLNVADFGCFLTKYAAGCP